MPMPPDDPDIDRHIGQKVRERREKLETTIEALAFRANIEISILREIEAGRRRTTSPQIVALFEALGVTISWFFEDL